VQPKILAPESWAATVAVALPFVLTALAETIPVLSGNGGLDLSVGPFTGFVTVLVAGVLVPAGISSPVVLIPLVLAIGLAAGLVNGIVVAYVRLPAIIGTLGTYLFYTGIAAEVLTSPGGAVPNWLMDLNGGFGWFPAAWIPLVVVGLAWWGLSRTAYVRNLLAVGGDDRAAFTAGINVAATRCWAYGFAGVLAALAGLMLTGLIRSGDATVGSPYTISAITAVALGGISLGGGRGGLAGAAVGGAALYLIQNLLIFSHVSVFEQQIANGLILILALAINGLLARVRQRRGAPQQMGALSPEEPLVDVPADSSTT
jgi:ribose transport system permease protein